MLGEIWSQKQQDKSSCWLLLLLFGDNEERPQDLQQSICDASLSTATCVFFCRSTTPQEQQQQHIHSGSAVVAAAAATAATAAAAARPQPPPQQKQKQSRSGKRKRRSTYTAAVRVLHSSIYFGLIFEDEKTASSSSDHRHSNYPTYVQQSYPYYVPQLRYLPQTLPVPPSVERA